MLWRCYRCRVLMPSTRVLHRQTELQATAADGADEENEEFDAIEKLDQLGVNRGIRTSP